MLENIISGIFIGFGFSISVALGNVFDNLYRSLLDKLEGKKIPSTLKDSGITQFEKDSDIHKILEILESKGTSHLSHRIDSFRFYESPSNVQVPNSFCQATKQNPITPESDCLRKWTA